LKEGAENIVDAADYSFEFVAVKDNLLYNEYFGEVQRQQFLMEYIQSGGEVNPNQAQV